MFGQKSDIGFRCTSLKIHTQPAALAELPKRRSDSILGTFHHDSLRAKILKTLTSLFEDVWVLNVFKILFYSKYAS